MQNMSLDTSKICFYLTKSPLFLFLLNTFKQIYSEFQLPNQISPIIYIVISTLLILSPFLTKENLYNFLQFHINPSTCKILNISNKDYFFVVIVMGFFQNLYKITILSVIAVLPFCIDLQAIFQPLPFLFGINS